VIISLTLSVAIVVVAASVPVSVVIRTGIPIVVGVVVVAASVSIPVIIRAGIPIPGVVIVSSVSVIVIAAHEGIGILCHRFSEFGMILQVGLQLGITLHIRFVVNQLGILAKLLADFAMAVEKAIESHALIAHALIFASIVTGFLVHERCWIFFEFLANRRVLLHEGL
jgi:hypothetical protein